MGLTKFKSAESTASAGAQRKTSAFGAVLRVKSTEIEEGKPFAIIATTMNDARDVGANVDVRIEFRDADKAERAKSNFEKGNGRRSLSNPTAAAGAIVYVESAYVVRPKDGEPASDLPTINASWLNTLAGADLSEDEANERSFIEAIVARAPKVTFENPFYSKEKAGDEPQRISIPVTASKVNVRVEGPQGVVNRDMPLDWALERLRAVTKGVSVRVDGIEPKEAKQVRSEDELKDALREAFGRGVDSFAVLRVMDTEDGEMATREVYAKRSTVNEKYAVDVEATIKDTFEKTIFRGYENAKILEAVAAGDVVLEVIPGYTFAYGANALKDNNAAFKLVKDLKEGQSTRMDMIFGKDPSSFASVLMPGIARAETYEGFTATAILADRNGEIHALKELVTPAITHPGKPLAADEAHEAESPRPA